MKHDSGTVSSGVGAPRRKSIIALIASFSMLLIGLVGIVAAPAASAHTNSSSLTCKDGLEVKLTAYATNQSHPNNNTVVVTLDGVQVVNQNFGSSFSYDSGQLDQYTSHNATIVVTAWDDSRYSFSKDYSIGACKSHKVNICHATGSDSNPYTTNEISWNGADNAANINWNGHGDHTGDIIPPFANFPGRNWDASGQATYNNGCKPPTVYTGHASASVDTWICYNGDNIHLTYNTGDVTDTSTVSQADADAKAQTKANAQRDAWLAGQLAQYPGYKEGKCTVYEGTGKATVDQWICTGTGEDQESVQLYKKFTETATSTISQADADQKAQKKADDAAAAWLADQLAKYPGAKEGKCNEYTGHGSASVDKWICADGVSVHLTYDTGDVTASSKISQAVANQKAQDKANAQRDAWLADQLAKYPGYKNGKCTATAQRSGEITICADEPVNQPSVKAIETRTVSWQTAVYQAEGATQAEAQAAADALADAAVPAAKAAALAPYPNYTDGACKDSTTYGASRGASGSTTICTADGKTVKVDWSGSAAVSGKNSQDEANTQAQNDANKAADADKAAKLAAFPGATQGACVPPTTTSPVVAPAPATVPAPAKKPAAKPVAAPKPASVPAGYAGTVPAAVPAGGGSSAPASGLPTWAILVMVAGAAGAVFSIKRLASQR